MYDFNTPEAPLVSIVTITFNAEKEIPATMKSVAAQTFTNYEHLIIDGASTDHTLEIAKNLASPSLRIVSEPDKGLYDAMNKGLRLARGKYVLFLNAGDAFHNPETLKKYAKAAEKGPDIIYGDTVIVDADRNIIGPRHFSVPETLTVESFSKGMLVCHQAFMVKREIAPPYNTRYRFSADYAWTIDCMKRTWPEKCINLNDVVIHYLTDGTTDRNKLKSLLERFRIMTRVYGLLPTLNTHIAKILK